MSGTESSAYTRGNSSAALAQTKTDYDAFLGDAQNLQAVRDALQDPQITAEQRKTLEIMQKTFLCYITEDPKATAMKVRSLPSCHSFRGHISIDIDFTQQLTMIPACRSHA